MESGAKGCEVVVSGKLRAARAKSMKFTDGFMIHSGQPARDFVDYAVRHVLLKQGVLGIKVKMYVLVCYLPSPGSWHLCSMKGFDPEGLTGPRKPLPDTVTIAEPPVDKIVSEPSSESRGVPEAPVVPPVAPPVEDAAYQADFQQEQFPVDQPVF
jgi:small subunit ribosomal protein S3e